jgi:hypothetical protein
MTDNWFNGIASAESVTLSRGDAAFLACDEDLGMPGVLMPLVAPIHLGFLWSLVTEDADLLELFTQDMAVVRVTGNTAHPHHKRFFNGGGKARFDPELVTFVGFTFADTLNFWHMKTVELIFAVAVLFQ